MAEIIIFDMDGTLIDTVKGTARAVRECAGAFGLPPLTADAIRGAVGWANPEFYHRLYPDLPWDVLLRFGDQVKKRENEILMELGKEILFPGVEEMLRTLGRMGKKLYLASTGEPAHVAACMCATGLSSCFSRIECGEPDKAAMLSRIVARHPGAKAVMVGDMIKDVEAAHANGLPVIGAGFGYCDAARAAMFDHVAAGPRELMELVW